MVIFLKRSSQISTISVNRIFLYDDKMVITFNYNKGTKTITFAELEASGILSISNIAPAGEPKGAAIRREMAGRIWKLCMLDKAAEPLL